MHPQLKPFIRHPAGPELVLTRELGSDVVLEDEDGSVAALLDLLDGTRTAQSAAEELGPRLGLAPADVLEGIAGLDEAGLLEDASAQTSLRAEEQERYFSNLEFFGSFATLDRSRFAFQEELRAKHVLLLGVGGLGSTTLLNLAGLGVGTITIVDRDTVALRNFSRQFLYDTRDVGASKVERAAARAHAFNPDVELRTVERLIERPEDLADLVAGVDLVVCVIDTPDHIKYWVNQACVLAGVPFVTGGHMVARGIYYSVVPGESACLACNLIGDRDWGVWRYDRTELSVPERTNRTIGPVASMLGGLVSLEALRILTRFSPPVAAARLWVVDTETGGVEPAYAWERSDDCPVCARRVERPLSPIEIVIAGGGR